MKANIYQIDGKAGKDIDLPKYFSIKVREDIVSRVLETKKTMQPYGPDPMAGKKQSASGRIIRRRHVWKSGYGRGASRVPRKQMSRRGTQFNWVGAFSPNTRGGRRAHPPKPDSMINTLKINKKELRLAFKSALSATADKNYILEKYGRIDKLEKQLPVIVESKLSSLKIKEMLSSLKNILGESLFEVAIKDKKIRAGRGSRRGRKYKKNAGMLLVIGNEEKVKTGSFDVVKVNDLGVLDLAKGGLGRLTVYTENAIQELNKKMEKKE